MLRARGPTMGILEIRFSDLRFLKKAYQLKKIIYNPKRTGTITKATMAKTLNVNFKLDP